MLLMISLVVILISLSNCDNDLKFRVLNSNEILVKIPKQRDGAKLILFRIGVIQNDNNDFEDIEIGENFIEDEQVYIHDKRLRLKSGDVINYLLGFRSEQGYRALTGKFTFNGEYKHPSRLRRDAASTASSESSAFSTALNLSSEGRFDEDEDGDEDSTNEFIGSRFGGRKHHHHHRTYHHNHGGNNWGSGESYHRPAFTRPPIHFHPQTSYGQPHVRPPFGRPPHFNPFNPPKPGNCNNNNNQWNNNNNIGPTTIEPTTSTDPDIDIRFGA